MNKYRGFVLIEIILTVTLWTVVCGYFWTYFSPTMAHLLTGIRRTQQFEAAFLAVLRLEKELVPECKLSVQSPAEISIEGPLGYEGPQRILFQDGG
jgi:hypothetical protein